MRHSRLGLLISLLSTIVHGVLLFFFVFDLVQLPYFLSKDNDGAITSRLLIVIDVFFFVLEIALCIASIVLVIGIKKERPQLMSPWIHLTGIFVVVHLLDLMRYPSYIKPPHTNFTVILKVIPIVLMAIVWYPIFFLWRKMIKTCKSHQSQELSGSIIQQGSNVCPSGKDNEHQSPMVYPNLGTAENLLEKSTLYPNVA